MKATLGLLGTLTDTEAIEVPHVSLMCLFLEKFSLQGFKIFHAREHSLDILLVAEMADSQGSKHRYKTEFCEKQACCTAAREHQRES